MGHNIFFYSSDIISALANSMAVIEIILFLQYFCGGHLNISGKRLYILWPACFLAFFLAYVFIPGSHTDTISVFVAIYLTVLLFSSLKLVDALLTVPAFFLYAIFSIFPPFIFGALFPYVNDTFKILAMQLHYSDLITDLTMLLILITIHVISLKKGLVFHINIREIVLAFILFCLVMLIMALYSLATIPEDSLSYATVFWNIFLPVSYFLCLFFYIYSLFEKRIRLQNETLARIQMTYLQTQFDALQNLKLQEDEIRKKRHDLKKHMAIIETLAEDGNYDEIKKYTSELSSGLPAAPVAISGNNIADIILSSRMDTARERGIRFNYEGSLAGLSEMPAPDLCSILANALDNALEACENIEDPYIDVKAVCTRNFTSISVKNPVLVKRHIHGNSISTTKKDKANHGYGLKIIQELAGKYHGKCLISCSKLEFSLRIQLQNP